MKRLFIVFVLTTISILTSAQKFSTQLYLGLGFAGVKSDVLQVSQLPISEGSMNFHYGLHVNYAINKVLEFETGADHVVKGFEYTNGLSSDYNKITTVSIPVILIGNILNYPDEVPIKLSVGLGLYGSYAVSGNIKHDDGSSQKATFSNANRSEFGPKLIAKTEFVHKVFAYLTDDFAATNIVKSGTGSIKQSSFQIGFGYKF